MGVLTKSPMILKDIDILKKIKNVEVGLSITTSDDSLSRFLEVRAPLASARINTLKKLNEAGISTYVFVGPLVPHIKLKPELLDKLLKAVAGTGTQNAKIEYLNLPSYVKNRLNKVLKDEPMEIQKIYVKSQTKKYREEMKPLIIELLKKHNFNLKYGEIVTHVENQNLKE